MRKASIVAGSLLIIAGFVVLAGCGRGPSANGMSGGADHDHSHLGMHGGQVIELGDSHYHAEVVHDDATRKVGVYLLDGSAQAAAPIGARMLAVNAVVGGEPKQYMLLPAPLEGETTGNCSYYEIVSKELCGALGDPEATVRISLTIEGKPYTGTVATGEHHHDDHDHEAEHSEVGQGKHDHVASERGGDHGHEGVDDHDHDHE